MRRVVLLYYTLTNHREVINMLSKEFKAALKDCNKAISEDWDNPEEGKFSIKYVEKTGIVAIETGECMEWAGRVFIEVFIKAVKSSTPDSYIMVWTHWNTIENCGKSVKHIEYTLQLNTSICYVTGKKVSIISDDIVLSAGKIRKSRPLNPELFQIGVTTALQEVRDYKWDSAVIDACDCLLLDQNLDQMAQLLS